MFRPFADLRLLPILLATVLLSGCAGTNQGNQGNPFAPAGPLATSVVARWEKEFATLDISQYRQEPERSALVYRLIFISDYRFSRYEADLMLGKATRDTFVDMSMFGLNAAASLLTPGQATQVLSAIAGGLSFSRNTIEKNFYMNHTAPVLIARMRVLRKEKLNEICANLRQSPRAYPIELAIIDVLDYYNRGTMLGALQSVSNQTSIQEIQAAGGEVRLPPAAPPVRLQLLKTAPVVISTRPEALNTTVQTSEFSSRRRALGGQVMQLRKSGDSTRAVAILAAGGVSATPDGAVRRLADAVDSISTRSSLDQWESAFAASPRGPAITPPPIILEPLPPLLPEKGKTAPAPPIPKQEPAKLPNRIDPL